MPATSVDRQCGSAQQAAHFVAQGVMAGAYDIGIACGVESMSIVGLGTNSVQPGFAFSDAWFDAVGGHQNLYTQFMAAQEIARRWKISREFMDEQALESHRIDFVWVFEGWEVIQAQRAGYQLPRTCSTLRAPGMTEVTRPDGEVEEMTTDECIRPNTSLEQLAALPQIQEGCPDMTAGNSSPISDGAAALLIASEKAVKEHGLKPRARFHAFAVAGCEPIVMLQGPIPATRKLLDRSGMSLDDFDLLECNEAMGSIVPMWEKEYGIDHARVNVNGSGISLGHPVGATGARIMTTLLHELERTGGRYGFQTMCEGGGQGNATVIERLA